MPKKLGKDGFIFPGQTESIKRETAAPTAVCARCQQEQEVTSFTRKMRHIYRKAYGELQLQKTIPTEFKDNDCIHVMTGGDVDSSTFLQYMLKFQDFEYMIFSTWCMAADDVQLMAEWLRTSKIERIDAYVGDIFKSTYIKEFSMLVPVIRRCAGRVAVFKNHNKTYAVKGRKFDFIIESSANINTNPRAENTMITIGTPGYLYLKEYYDKVVAFNKNDFKDWKPYKG